MGCSACKEVIDPSLEVAELEYSVSANSVAGHAIASVLLKANVKPAKGWAVVLPIKGQLQKINGINPREVAYNALKLFSLNGLRVDKNVLWFNLNLQWLQRTNPKFHLVPLDQLLEISMPQLVINEDPHAVQKISDAWITTVVESIKIHLMAEEYKWDEFLVILNRFQRYLNPTENPLLGDVKRYTSFTLQLEKVKRNPIYDREKAKEWFDTVNI